MNLNPLSVLFPLWVALLSTAMLAAPAHADDDDKPNSVTLLAGIPHPANLAYDRHLGDKFSVGLDGGSLTLPFTGSGGTSYSLGVSNAELRARWHPFSGSFFLGVILGYQSVNGTADIPVTVSNQTINTTTSISIQSGYLTPHLGWMGHWSGGFTLGFDFGIQIPFSPRTAFSTTTDDPSLNSFLPQIEATSAYQKAVADVQSAGNRVGSLDLPYITVLRLGWSF